MKLTIAILLAAVAHTAFAGVYTDRFNIQYQKMKNPGSGYFSRDGVPYHAVETLIVEAPDHGHETTSEAFSYYVWLEALHGKISGDFSGFNQAWDVLEKYIIPPTGSQPTNSFYNPGHPATFIPEEDQPSQYPSQIDTSVSVGQDPLHQELVAAYGTSDIYAMHWLLDVDNVYGFGNTAGNCQQGPNAQGPSYINTFQRGAMESVWRTIPQPTCDNFQSGGQNGFLDLFTKDNSYAKQWKFTNAPDADARAIQAAFWAGQWAQEHGQLGTIQGTLAKAAKMGDYIRYAFFDKYFKQIGNCVSPQGCPAGSGKNSAHYLLGWYFAWGGSLDTNGGWAWRIGDGTAHFGYQNPLAAYALANDPNLRPRGATAVSDWQTSLQRQLELYGWLQTPEGAFAGGVTNSINGRYDAPSGELTQNTFHGMFYDWEPVYHDPPSNRWYGMQPWSVDRLAQYYYVTGDNQAKALLDKWVAWVLKEIKVIPGTSYQVPEQLEWSGVPPNVHVSVKTYSGDVGTGAATARTLSYYAAKANHAQAKEVAKEILDIMWWKHQTDKGVAVEEVGDSYHQFNEPVYVPPGWTGRYPNGDTIQSGATFLSIRSFYKRDPNWSKVEAHLNGGPPPTFTFHRFWAQADIALAQGCYGILFNE
ncbi:unnamed protein product [Diabrotica balteata]|uniref:Glycoside hydrolase family protein 48 n=1 Tax=Diabrotica balteata TaxID=107213 RepID=A0A9N9XB63_DIABA|nr:unnamed protein product [Diabrotica balteata]